MNMSKAALPPRQPLILEKDRKHPLFAAYEQHRSSCNRLLVEASSFADWLCQYEHDVANIRAAAHPKYSAFLDWMRDNQGGARKCPVGAFPHNLYYWIDGGRW